LTEKYIRDKREREREREREKERERERKKEREREKERERKTKIIFLKLLFAEDVHEQSTHFLVLTMSFVHRLQGIIC
jgi:hypothetical protein